MFISLSYEIFQYAHNISILKPISSGKFLVSMIHSIESVRGFFNLNPSCAYVNLYYCQVYHSETVKLLGQDIHDNY